MIGLWLSVVGVITLLIAPAIFASRCDAWWTDAKGRNHRCARADGHHGVCRCYCRRGINE